MRRDKQFLRSKLLVNKERKPYQNTRTNSGVEIRRSQQTDLSLVVKGIKP